MIGPPHESFPKCRIAVTELTEGKGAPDVAEGSDKPVFNKAYYLIALLPALVFLVSQLLLKYYANPYDIVPEKISEFATYREGAARIGLLAAFMLFFGAAVAGFLFFLLSLYVCRTAAGPMIAGFLMLAAAAVLTQQVIIGRPAEEYAGLSLFCMAAGYGTEAERASRISGQAVPPPGVAVERLPSNATCPYPRFSPMQALLSWQFRGTAVAFAGLVMAGIFSLAGPVGGDEGPSSPPLGRAEADLRHWERQSQWLNASLYLSALLLVTNILFVYCFLQWPAFLLPDRQGRDTYVGAMVCFYGVAFSTMLVAYYVPVAAILASRVKEGQGSLQAFKGPVQRLKIATGLLSTTLAGLLPVLLDLIR